MDPIVLTRDPDRVGPSSPMVCFLCNFPCSLVWFFQLCPVFLCMWDFSTKGLTSNRTVILDRVFTFSLMRIRRAHSAVWAFQACTGSWQEASSRCICLNARKCYSSHASPLQRRISVFLACCKSRRTASQGHRTTRMSPCRAHHDLHRITVAPFAGRMNLFGQMSGRSTAQIQCHKAGRTVLSAVLSQRPHFWEAAPSMSVFQREGWCKRLVASRHVCLAKHFTWRFTVSLFDGTNSPTGSNFLGLV